MRLHIILIPMATAKTRQYLLVAFTLILIVAVLVSALVMTFRLRHRDDPLVYGASFSKAYAEHLGLDWRATLNAALTELEIGHLRLMSYWSEIEPEPGKYSFEALDYQFEQAAKHGAKISLAIGLRQPRWPECHEPAWAKSYDDEAWEHALMTYLAKTVERYRNHPNLDSYQLENEFFNRDFGSNCRNYSRKRFRNEAELVRQLDNKHSLIMNQSNQGGLPLRPPRPDVYGFSIYRRQFEARVLKTYITHPVPAWYHSLRAQLIEMYSGKAVVIHELQAEPWTNGPITEATGEEQVKTLSIEQLKRNLEFANRTGIKTQYLWGVEYWYWRKTIHKDPSYWQVIQQAVQSAKQ